MSERTVGAKCISVGKCFDVVSVTRFIRLRWQIKCMGSCCPSSVARHPLVRESPTAKIATLDSAIIRAFRILCRTFSEVFSCECDVGDDLRWAWSVGCVLLLSLECRPAAWTRLFPTLDSNARTTPREPRSIQKYSRNVPFRPLICSTQATLTSLLHSHKSIHE